MISVHPAEAINNDQEKAELAVCPLETEKESLLSIFDMVDIKEDTN